MSSRTRAILVSLMMCAMTLSGCLHLDNDSQKIIDGTEAVSYTHLRAHET